MKKMSKAIAIILVVAVMLSCFGACAPKDDGGVPVIKVGFMPYYASVPLQVIEDEKLDEKYGFKMKSIAFPSGGPMAEALGAGEWDIGQIGAGGMVAIPNYNAKLICDVQYEMDGAWIFARPDSAIVKAGKTLSDFPELIGSAGTIKGLKVLGTVGNISHYMAIDYVSKFGLNISDVNFVHMETAQIYNAFVTGNGDIACIGSPAAGLKLLNEGYVKIGGLKDQGNPQQDAMLISDDFYKNHREESVNFMKAWFEAVEKLNADEKYEIEMTKKFYSVNGRSDFDDEGVARECSWNKFIDATNYKEKEVGAWMKGLVKCYVDSGAMDKSVIDALNKNIKTDIIEEALAK